MRRLKRLRTYARIGPASIARVAAYRLGLMTGWHPALRLSAAVPARPFFRASERRGDVPSPNKAWDDALHWFGWYQRPLPSDTPNWFGNPFSETRQPDASRDWWRISDFGAGDIKGLWELSRFNWVLAWSTKAADGDTAALKRMNHWLADWARENPPYKGPNWKCGQEASIRVLHLVASAWALGQDRAPEPGLVDLTAAHLQRIASTISYAIGQQNNHGTSEAAALFIGGSFLSGSDPRAETWARTGRRRLEERAATLIEPDGSFSQYSVTYHRLMLDTYALSEAWRRHRGLPEFSTRLRNRLAAATDWLWSLIDSKSGDAPNIGANDGAHLLQLTGADYRDFRPSVQLAAALFRGADAFGPGPWMKPLRWLEVADGKSIASPHSQSFNHGGYHVLRIGSAMAVLRYPRFRFRPSQADGLHVDLWRDGINLLRDAGTFSYNAEDSEWFSGTAAHNTIEFDGRDQMIRLGRFLFGDWLSAQSVEAVRDDGDAVTAAAAYTDAKGARHHRTITLTADGMLCRDVISGNFREACLRWRLAPGQWQLDDTIIRSGTCSISIEVDGVPMPPTIGATMESRHYHHRAEIPFISVKVNRAATIVTEITF
ncbi:heparinase II/III family protein [Roseitalea porphyridii]|uniref:Alginate lyase family protein n=1 Tax=Roseitalea porphyridii TaxID=1852022 RepID=A0A4P6V273_9HYPH|nr:heparinase II/III-family protein [Roseitalea porphyridii]QBK30804.1 alginate lyase family protein [Roseitalea porphyridii]